MVLVYVALVGATMSYLSHLGSYMRNFTSYWFHKHLGDIMFLDNLIMSKLKNMHSIAKLGLAEKEIKLGILNCSIKRML